MSKKIPEVRIPVFAVDRLMLLTEAQLKVWLYYKRRYGADGKAWGKASTIAEATGLVKGTVKNARAWLVKNEWLRPNGSSDKGLPMFKPVIGKLPSGVIPELPQSFSNDGESNSKMTGGVISELPGESFSNDTEVATLEVPTTEAPTSEALRPSDEVSELVNVTPSLGSVKTEEKPRQLTTEEHGLLWEVLPVHAVAMTTDPTVKSRLGAILSLADSVGVDAVDLLRYNRTHKKGALYIRTLEQFFTAMDGDEVGNYALVNEYIEHTSHTCKLCKDAPKDKRPEGYAQMNDRRQARKEEEERRKEIAQKREYLRQEEGWWDYSFPDREKLVEFNRVIREGKEARGITGKWYPEGFSLVTADRTEDSKYWRAAVNYIVRTKEYVEFNDFKSMMHAAKDYALISAEVQKYDKAQGATA
jgi:hypothetical protein